MWRYHKPKRLSCHGPMTIGYAFLAGLMLGTALMLLLTAYLDPHVVLQNMRLITIP